MIVAKKEAGARIPFETLERVSAALRVLAHPLRLTLVELLESGELPVNQLVEQTGAAPNAVSQHLNMMKAHGLLASRRDGRRVLYRVAAPEAFSVIECIRAHYT